MDISQNYKKVKKKKSKSLLILVVFLVVLYIVSAPFIKEYTSTKSVYGDTVSFVIEEGATASDVAQNLVDKGLIKYKYSFLIKYRLNRDIYKNIYRGTYYLNKGMCLNDIMDTLLTQMPNANTFVLTVPEGYSIEMIAAKCEEMGVCSKDEFISTVSMEDYNYEFIKHIPQGNYKYKLEGFMFPSTYEFYEDVSPRDIVDKMLATFETEYLKANSSYDNLFENMIIASMVEREAVLDTERATIAGVIKNRLKKPMMLQIDATVVYAKSNGRYDMTKVINSDLEVDSPYNLYKHEGLTPGPICNPGIKSIVAAANPESHNWYFYHTDETKKDGSHIFTQTFNEHLSTMN